MTVQWEKYLANGISKSQGPVAQRKDIRDLTQIEMYLFLEGLAKFQRTDMTEPLSYFQLAGIHGLPYETWPKGNTEIKPRTNFQQDPNSFGGFCAHTSILFLPWHRPYLALFESTLYKHVNEIAAGVTAADKTPYLEAARAFRLPYWDWAKRERSSVFPIQALAGYNPPTPTTSTNSVPHEDTPDPLEKAPFQDGVTPDITMGNATTVRYPGDPTAVEDLRSAIRAYLDQPSQNQPSQPQPPPVARNLSERVSYIMRGYQRYGPMSNNAFTGSSSSATSGAEVYGSLEDIHNSIHNYTGGNGGHMSDPIYAAFDPIFWLHHCNIDRLFAIWQVLHQDKNRPDSWITQRRAVDSFATSSSNFEDENSPLYPFRRAVDGEHKWYTSDDTKWTEDFGYTYAEIAGLKPEEAGPEAIKKLGELIGKIYPTPAQQIRSSLRKVPTAGDFLLPQTAILKKIADTKVPATVNELIKVSSALPEPPKLLEQSLEPSKPLLGQLAPDRQYLEWLVDIKAVKHALGGKYTVTVFLGPVEEPKVELWPFSPNFVGTFYPFGQDGETPCAKCQHDQANQVQVTSQIPLTFALMERYLAGIVPDLTPEGVKPYLAKNLHWRVTVNGTILDDRSQVDGLTVFVVSNRVTIPEDDSQEPIYDANVTLHPEITTKVGGGGRGEGTGLAIDQQ